MAPFNNDPNQPQQGQAPWSGDYSARLNEMLAPYQQMAQQFQSPYATMRPNSWIAQNHPQLAQKLDNAFLTMGMTPDSQGPEGVGGGISRTMQGLIGAQQFHRQQMMQNAMLPYQMMMPQLQAQDMVAQMDARRATAMREQDYHEMITDRYGPAGLQAQRNAMEQQKIEAFLNPSMLDHRRALAKAGLPANADISNVHPEKLELYNQAYQGFRRERERSAPAGSYEEQIENMRLNEDPAVRAQGERRWADHLQVLGLQAGRVAGAKVEAEQPVKDQETFLKEETANAYKDIQPPKPFDQWLGEQGGLAKEDVQMDTSGAQRKAYIAKWTQVQKGYEQANAQRGSEVQQWKQSAAKQGIPFMTWRADPSKYAQQGPGVKSAPAPTRMSTTPATAPASTKALVFNPDTGKLE